MNNNNKKILKIKILRNPRLYKFLLLELYCANAFGRNTKIRKTSLGDAARDVRGEND